MKLVILLFKKIILCKDNLRVFFFIKKFLQICTETLQDVCQCRDGRRSQITFQLGDKSFGKLCPVGKFLLCQ